MGDHSRTTGRDRPAAACDARGGAGDSFPDAVGGRNEHAGLDPLRLCDSDGMRATTNVPEHLPQLLPGEGALVYQHLRSRLAAVFDGGGD